MKKLLLSLGTVAAIAAPVASVIACGSTPASGKIVAVTNEQKTDVFDNYNLKDADANNFKVTVQKGTEAQTIIVVSFNSLKAVAGHDHVSALVKGTNTIKMVLPKTGGDSIFFNGKKIEDTDLAGNLRWVASQFLPNYRKAFPSN